MFYHQTCHSPTEAGDVIAGFADEYNIIQFQIVFAYDRFEVYILYENKIF